MNIARTIIASLLLLALNLPRLSLGQEAPAEEAPSWAGVAQAELFWQLPVALHDMQPYERQEILEFKAVGDDGVIAIVWHERWSEWLTLYRIDRLGRVAWKVEEHVRDYSEFYFLDRDIKKYMVQPLVASYDAKIAVGPSGEIAFCNGDDGVSLYEPDGSLRWRQGHGRLEDCSLLSVLSDSSVLIGGKIREAYPPGPTREIGLMRVLPDGAVAWRLALPVGKEAAWPILPAELSNGSVTVTVQSPWVDDIIRSDLLYAELYAVPLIDHLVRTWQLRLAPNGRLHPPDDFARSPMPPNCTGWPGRVLVTDAKQLIRSFDCYIDERLTEQWLQIWSSDGNQLIETRHMTESPAPDGRLWSPYVGVLFSGKDDSLYMSRWTEGDPSVRGICKMSSGGGQSCVRIDFPENINAGAGSPGEQDLYFLGRRSTDSRSLYRVPITAVIQ